MILIYCSLVAMVIVTVIMNNMVRQRNRRKRILWAAKWIGQLRCLLELFPKHRGMANALLKGDDSFRPSLEKLQHEVDARLQSMRRLIEERGDKVAECLLQPMERQWQVIRDGVFNLAADKSFALHTKLIELVIERMEDDSLQLKALAHNNKQLSLLQTMLTRDLPRVVESIGQARGIGTGVAAQRASNVANRVKLKFLYGKSTSIINNKLVPVRSAIRDYQDMESVIDCAVASAQNFLGLLQNELIDKATPNVSPEQFYQQGTVAIEAGFQLFDKLYPRCLQTMDLR